MPNIKIISVLFSMLLFIYSCEKDQVNRNFEDDPAIINITGIWQVVSYEDFLNNTVIKKSDVDSWNGMDVTLTFTANSIYGWNTTNAVVGNFIVTGRNIHIISYGGTKMGQPEWGNMFSSIIYKLESFEINKSQLRFFYNDKRNSVTLNRTYLKPLPH